MGDRSFLFLQGPHGAFFFRLGEALARDGHVVHRVNLNGGDRHDWPAREGANNQAATDYRGTLDAWPAAIDALMGERGVTDLVLFGDCRPYHAAAHRAATARGARVHVVEEGYIRPDYMTVERDGVNGHSRLPRDPDAYRRAAAKLPPEGDPPFVPSSFDYRARQTFRHGLAALTGRWRFPHYRGHRTIAAPAEALGWALRWLGRGVARRRTERASASFVGRPYFAFPLQLDTDYQLRVHSPFDTVEAALAHSVASFAAHAPADTHLVVKRHPLDGSLTNWAAIVARLAHDHGLTDRLHYLPGRDTSWLVSEARGVVTVNSTVGTLALNAGVAVCVLGEAVYAVPGIVHPGGLDGFWTAPQAPDAELYQAFRRVLLDRVLVAGGYGSDEGIAMLVNGTRDRLLRPEDPTAWD